MMRPRPAERAAEGLRFASDGKIDLAQEDPSNEVIVSVYLLTRVWAVECTLAVSGTGGPGVQAGGKRDHQVLDDDGHGGLHDGVCERADHLAAAHAVGQVAV
eukprot:6495173-Pyramimonas_sp.AAC.1